jgi:clan AA aspartic protease
MSFAGPAILVSLRVRNPIRALTYPSTGEVEAILDTGYGGFLFVPKTIFDALGLRGTRRSKAVLADGRSLGVREDFATVEFPGQGVKVDGLIQTAEGAEEVLLGMEGMRKLFIGIDSCARRVSLEAC